MALDFSAHTPAELANIRQSLFTASKQNALDEQVQMTRLLESLAHTQVLQYPTRVRHTGNNSVPDFQMESGTRLISVEITKIAIADVEHARALQHRGLNQTLAISSLYQKKDAPRRKQEVITEGFLTPSMSFPVSVEEHNRIWLEEAQASLVAKSVVIARDDFKHGDEDWLLLWDRIGTSEWELAMRRQSVARLLERYWKPRWFSCVFLQDHHFFWQAMFTPTGSTMLPSHRSGI